MNQDELISHGTSLLLALGSAYLGAHGISDVDAQTLIGALVTIGAGGFKVYSHWNQKKVPENAVVVGQK